MAVLLSVAPVLLLTAALLQNQLEGMLLDRIETSLSAQLSSSIESLDQKLVNIKDIASIIAEDPTLRRSIDTGVSIGVNSQLNRLARIYTELNYLAIIGKDQKVFAISTRRSDGTVLSGVSVLDASIEAASVAMQDERVPVSFYPGHDFFRTELGLSDEISQWVFAPIIVRGETAGWVLLSYRFELVMRELQTSQLHNLLEDGAPVSATSIGLKSGYTIRSELPFIEKSNSMVREVIYKVGGTDFTIALAYDKKKIMAPLSRLSVIVAITFIILALLILACMYWGVRTTILTPMEKLSVGADKYTKGDFSHKVNVFGNNEISDLAAAFNHMGEELQASQSTLETEIRKRTFEAQSALVRLEAIVSTAADGIITTDADGTIKTANRRVESLFDYTEEELVGSELALLFEQNELNKLLFVMHGGGTSKHSLENGLEIELRGQRKDKSDFPLQVSVSRVSANNEVFYTAILRDTSKIKETERLLVEAKENAEHTAQHKSDFLASMSHEIRTPMNGIIGMLNTVLRSQLTREQEHRANLAKSSAESLLNIINDILDFSKNDSGKTQIDVIDFNLIKMLGEVAETYGQRAEEAGLVLSLDTVGIDSTSVIGDPVRIRQILTNLVSNAIKFTASGEVAICARLERADELVADETESSDEMRLVCEVRDSGIGIPEEKQETVFDVFAQVDASTTRKYGGTGLGLAISKQLSELMGGGIRVQSHHGEGSVFTFEISIGTSVEAVAVSEMIGLREMRILVTDRDTFHARVVAKQLETWGAAVDVVYSEIEMEKRLENTQGDGCIYDYVFLNSALIDGREEAYLGAEKLQALLGGSRLVLMSSVNDIVDPATIERCRIHSHFARPATMQDLYQSFFDMDKGTKSLLAFEEMTKEYRHELKILLVEDNEVNQIVVEDLLDDMDMRCDIASNGEEAIAALKQCSSSGQYHIILMDCQMPVMDGYVATEKIRSGEAGECYKNAAIIALTANAMKGDRERCLATGMSDYLSKPIDPRELEVKMLSWAEKSLKEEMAQKEAEENMGTQQLSQQIADYASTPRPKP